MATLVKQALAVKTNKFMLNACFLARRLTILRNVIKTIVIALKSRQLKGTANDEATTFRFSTTTSGKWIKDKPSPAE